MKIPIQSEKQLNKYLQLFFDNLQKDKQFERLITKARQKLLLEVPILKETDILDIDIKSQKPLRSESISISKTRPSIYIETNTDINLDKEVEDIIKNYPFLQDWRTGLRKFICGDRFVIPQDETSILIRIRNKKFPYKGRFTDRFNEEGVKIILTSLISKNELKNWVDDNFETIKLHLKELPNLSKNSPRRSNFERDRLNAYLHTKWDMTFKQIADLLQDGSTENSLQKAYKDFPYQ